MDEADHITPEAQACFRRILEIYSKHTRFIFTANFPYRLVGPLLSRFLQFEFPSMDVKTIAKHLKRICIKEGIKDIEDKRLIAIANRSGGDLRQAIIAMGGSQPPSEAEEIWGRMTYQDLLAMNQEERVKLAFAGEPDVIFGKIWEFVQREKKWSLLPALADCNAKMNYSIHKTIFIANFLNNLK
jgi:DNA polymerase III delta prime subunit